MEPSSSFAIVQSTSQAIGPSTSHTVSQENNILVSHVFHKSFNKPENRSVYLRGNGSISQTMRPSLNRANRHKDSQRVSLSANKAIGSSDSNAISPTVVQQIGEPASQKSMLLASKTMCSQYIHQSARLSVRQQSRQSTHQPFSQSMPRYRYASYPDITSCIQPGLWPVCQPRKSSGRQLVGKQAGKQSC